MRFARTAVTALVASAALFVSGPSSPVTAATEVVAFDLVGSSSQNLVSFVNNAPAFSSAGDAFGKLQRPDGPFAVLDDSLSIFPGDSQGIIDENNTDQFFAIVDTENGDNTGLVSASWVFDISGAADLGVSIDLGAMGDFESSDIVTFTYAIDGGAEQALFSPVVDEAGSQDYTLAGGATFTLSDPFTLNGVNLTNVLTTYTAPVDGTGDELTITVTAQADGGSEAVAFQNLVITAGTCGGGGPADPLELAIHEVQGTGEISPVLGELVVIDGIVVGDYQMDGQWGGFHVQEPDSSVDGDATTSEGVFVFHQTTDVSLGDEVVVTGRVDEFGGHTEIVDATVEIVSSGNALPSAAALTLPFAALSDLEAYESMLVTLADTVVVSEYFNFDRFGEVVVAKPVDGEGRPFNPTAVFDPITQETEAFARLDLNLRSRITVDDSLTSQNPELPVNPFTGEPFTFENSFRGGDAITGLTGPLHYAFNQYRLLPHPFAWDSYVPNERELEPSPVGGSLRIASLNTLNYFTTIDPGPDICGPTNSDDCRGADDAEEFERQRVKLLNTLEGLDADIIGLNELENTLGVEALADLAAGLNDRLGAGTYDYVAAGVNGVVGPDAIKVGIIYRTSAVAAIGDVAVLDDPAFINPNNLVDADGNPDPKNRAAVAASFVDRSTGGVVSVVVNHLKSKGSECGPGDDDPLAASCNETRTKAAEYLAGWLDTDPTGVGDTDWMILGDLNSYDKETPIQALTAAGFTDLIASYGGEFAYSYVFDGQFGYLDYNMSSASLTPQVTGATEWHINADESDVFDYDTRFKSDYQDDLFDPTSPFRSSDHDAAISGVDLALDAEIVIAWVRGEVDELEASGSLNKGQANSLRRSLDQAQRQLDRGQVNGALGILQGVREQLSDFVADGILAEAEAMSLIAAIDAIRSGLS